MFPSNKMNASLSKSQIEQDNFNDPSKGNNIEDDTKIKLNVTYQGYNIFRKSLVIIIEPLDKIIEFGDNVQIATAMTIDDYFGKDDDENKL